MARKKEPKLIHPRTIIESQEAYLSDVTYLLVAVGSAISFMENKELDAERLRTVLAPQLKEAHQRVSRWSEAD